MLSREISATTATPITLKQAMAGHHNEDQSLYDFLVEEPEMMAAGPSGHLDFGSRPQQPTSNPNRTSNERQTPIQSTNPHHIPVPPSSGPAAAAPSSSHIGTNTNTSTTHSNSMPMSILANQSRVESPAHSHPHPLPATSFDLHAHSAPATASVFARPPLPSGVGHVPIDWGMYGAAAHPGIPLNPTGFHFEVPPHNAIPPQFAHHSDPALAGAYGSELVSPTSIHHGAHVAHGHYHFGAPWDEGMDHESSTPTVTTPAAVSMTNNPWVDPNEVQNEEDNSEISRGKQKGRSKRPKRNAGESSAGASTEPTSPSSASQHSRASVASKSASIASTSTASSRQSRLRSASRTSKNNLNKPNDTPEDRRTRASHNLVEKQYRNRLNAQFESLLCALPEQIRQGGDAEDSDAADSADRRVSKGEVLEMARKHIQSLERERDILEKEKNELLGSLRNLKGSLSSEETTSSSQGTPIDFNINMDDDKAGEDVEK